MVLIEYFAATFVKQFYQLHLIEKMQKQNDDDV